MSDLPSSEDPIDEALRARAWENVRSYAANALTNTDAGEEGRMYLSKIGLQTEPLSLVGLSERPGEGKAFLVAPETEAVGALTLPLEWAPKVEYRFHPSRGAVEIRDQGTIPSVNLECGINELRQLRDEITSNEIFPDRYLTELLDALGHMTEKVGASAGDPHSRLPTIRAMKESAQDRQKYCAERGREKLKRIRETLFALALVALEGEDHGSIPPKENFELYFVPTKEYRLPTEELERSRSELRFKAGQRRALIADHSRTGLFVRELRYLWTLITDRCLKEHHLQSIADHLEVPRTVTDAAAHAVEALYNELKTIDSEHLSFQARETACEILATGTVSDKSQWGDRLKVSHIQERIEDATEKQKELAKIGLKIYESGEYDGRASLLEDMAGDEEVIDLVGAVTRKTLTGDSYLGPLYVEYEGEQGRPPKKTQVERLDEMIRLWKKIDDQ